MVFDSDSKMVNARPFCRRTGQDDDIFVIVSTNLLQTLRYEQATRPCLTR